MRELTKLHLQVFNLTKENERLKGFADWIVMKGYKLNQMNHSNNGGMWFTAKDSIGVSTDELYIQFKKELTNKKQ